MIISDSRNHRDRVADDRCSRNVNPQAFGRRCSTSPSVVTFLRKCCTAFSESNMRPSNVAFTPRVNEERFFEENHPRDGSSDLRAGANRIRDGGSEKSVGGSRPRVEGGRAIVGGDGTCGGGSDCSEVAIVSLPVAVVCREVHARSPDEGGRACVDSVDVRASASHPLACSTRLCAVGDETSGVTTDLRSGAPRPRVGCNQVIGGANQVVVATRRRSLWCTPSLRCNQRSVEKE